MDPGNQWDGFLHISGVCKCGLQKLSGGEEDKKS